MVAIEMYESWLDEVPIEFNCSSPLVQSCLQMNSSQTHSCYKWNISIDLCSVGHYMTMFCVIDKHHFRFIWNWHVGSLEQGCSKNKFSPGVRCCDLWVSKKNNWMLWGDVKWTGSAAGRKRGVEVFWQKGGEDLRLCSWWLGNKKSCNRSMVIRNKCIVGEENGVCSS
jgi:hypothetical protein